MLKVAGYLLYKKQQYLYNFGSRGCASSQYTIHDPTMHDSCKN